MSRIDRMMRLDHNCAGCLRSGRRKDGQLMCYYDFQDERTTGENGWCARFLPKAQNPTARLINSRRGPCCEACGYRPNKWDTGKTCPVCKSVWEEEQQQE